MDAEDESLPASLCLLQDLLSILELCVAGAWINVVYKKYKSGNTKKGCFPVPKGYDLKTSSALSISSFLSLLYSSTL